MFVFWVPERARVVVISCLECAFCKSNVGFFMLVICSGYCGLVHNAFCKAFSTERARFFLAAIALFRWIFGGFGLLVKDSSTHPTVPMLLQTSVTNSYKIFHRNALKLSYSCMPNVHQIITAHNKTVLDKQTKPSENPPKECNCRQKESCPLRGKCLTESVVYQATVTRTDNQHKETYVGLTEGAFKTRYKYQ